jgi:hypothetical protein
MPLFPLDFYVVFMYIGCVIHERRYAIMPEINPDALRKASRGGNKNITLTAPPDFIKALEELSSKFELKKSILVRYLVYVFMA